MNVTLTTAGGSACTIGAGNPDAVPVVKFLADAMGLVPNFRDKDSASLSIVVGEEFQTPSLDGLECRMPPAADIDKLATDMIWLSPFLAQQVQSRGGALIHGALAEWGGCGVIFAGPGGVGKSTISRRLPSPWRSLSDDMTLIDRDANGAYWAHPWPTWSRFMWGGEGGSWDVQRALPLRAIFILEQADRTQIEPCGAWQAAMLLQEVADQASFFAYDSLDCDCARRFRIERFNSVCAIAKQIPTAILRTSLSEPFADFVASRLTAKTQRTQRSRKEEIYLFAHTGVSMNPTLTSRDLLEVQPYGNTRPRCGDVILFTPPGYDQPFVHRIAKISASGITTRGDNATADDPWLLKPHEVFGRVEAACRGKARRPILRGTRGRLYAHALRAARTLYRYCTHRYFPITRRAQ